MSDPTSLRQRMIILVLACSLPALAADRCDELVAAARINDIPRLAELINGGTGVDCRDPQTAETALMAAAMNGKLDAVKFLVMSGANPNLKDVSGKTALGIVRNRERALEKVPTLADLVQRQRQVIAFLQPRTEGGPASQLDAVPLEAAPAEPDRIARLKLETARAALMTGQYQSAMKALSDVFALQGVSERNRAKAMAVTADLSMRRQDWKMAKLASERVLRSSGPDDEDLDFCKDVLKTLRLYHPELFR